MLPSPMNPIRAMRASSATFRRQSKHSRAREVKVASVRRTLPMVITVFIRYQLDPLKRDAFEAYAERRRAIIARCGGDRVGYWMPRHGTHTIAFALILFESLAAYAAYRARLRADAQWIANFQFAENERFILAEERA